MGGVKTLWRAPAIASAVAILCASAAPPAHHEATAGHRTAVFMGSDLLQAVAATSARNAWAVGNYFAGGSIQRPLIEHWNGSHWQIAPSPAVGKDGGWLTGLAALSARNVWAVGGRPAGALIEHWSGGKWRLVPAAKIKGASTDLAGVAAASAKSAWAVGSKFTAKGIEPLIERWTGHTWKAVPCPDPGGPAAQDYLTGVTISKSGVWAVGTSAPGNVYRTLVLGLVHGKWRVLHGANPAAGLGNWLGAVSAAGHHVLAAGFGGYDNPVNAYTLVLHQAGPAFKLDKTPNPGGSLAQDELYGVAATPAGGWAVGRSAAQTLTLREVAGHWLTVPSPSWPSPATSILEGVAAVSHSAWAVGQYNVDVGSVSVSYSLILRWTGSKWKQIPSPNR
jgi:hypothetical protein